MINKLKNIFCGIFILSAFTITASAQNHLTAEDYTKAQYDIEMRDGVKLHTIVYSPKDRSQEYPIIIKRTPYSCRPYEEEVMPRRLHNNPYLVEDGYIFVCQDVRGRWMSEGDYSTMTPNNDDPKNVDESSDAYDTIEWLLENIPNNNGKVGMYGISYPGFYTTAALPDAHPALVASSPQAPIADFFFDDFHRHGAYTMSYWAVTPWFGIQTEEPTSKNWYPRLNIPTEDDYSFYLNEVTPLSKSAKYFREDNFLWDQLVNHPNYDKFWQARNILPHLRNIDHAVLTIGGWFDAQDLYGPLNIYKTIEKENPEAENTIVMGPWKHGEWAGVDEHQLVGDIYFASGLTNFYKKHIEYPFFRHHLKGDTTLSLPEAYMFDTGTKNWDKFTQWPPENAGKKTFYVHDNGSLNQQKPGAEEQDYSQYISSIDNPVPATQTIAFGFIPPYQTADQRFSARRPDVLTFTTDVLEQDVTISGKMLVNLHVSTSGTASDWVVKVIDVYPASYPEGEHTPEGVELDNYHQMVRGGVIRGRFRDSYAEPKPFEPGKVTYVDLSLLSIHHTFKKGHRIQIQIQSTWFPLADLNPQTYVENIFKAEESDFQDAVQRVYHTPEYPTSIEVKVLE